MVVKLRVQDTYLDCGTLQYLEDPRFTGYRVESEIDTELEVKIQVCMHASLFLSSYASLSSFPPFFLSFFSMAIPIPGLEGYVSFHAHPEFFLSVLFIAERKRQFQHFQG